MSYDLGTAHGKIVLDYDGKNSTKQATKDIKDVDKSSKDADKGIKILGKSFGELASSAGKLAGKAAFFSEASVGAANLGIQILGIIPQLTSILSLSAAIPGAIVGIAASVGVLKTAFSGVGDALKLAFDPKKAKEFQAALDKLSPSAQAFAKSIQASGPAFREMKLGIQEAFFAQAQLAKSMPALLNILTALRPQLVGLSGDFGRTANDLVNFGKNGKTVAFVNDAIVAFRNALNDVTPSLVPILEGLRSVGTIGLTLIPRLGAAVSGVATNFADWLAKISASGQLQTWINTAISTLNTLGGLLKNIGSIFTSVVTAAAATGGGLLNTLEGLTGQLATFLKSSEGTEALTSIFSAIASVAKPLGPIIVTLAGALAKALGPAIVALTGVLGPALLNVVKTLAPALAPLAAALSSVLQAVIPILGPISELVKLLATYLSVALQQLASELGPVIALFAGALTDALKTFEPVLALIAKTILPAAAEAGAGLAKALGPLAPAIVQVATAVSGALLKALPQILPLLPKLTDSFVQLAGVMADGLAKSLIDIIPLLPPLITAFVQIVGVFLRVETAAVKVLTFLFKFPGAIEIVKGSLGGIKDALSAVGSFFSTIGHAISSFFTSVTDAPSKAAGVFKTFGSAITGALSAIGGFLSTIGGTIIGFFTSLPGKILAGLQALPGLLVAFIKGALTSLVVAVAFALGLIVGIFTKLPGDIVRGLQTLGPIVGHALKTAWDNAVAATISGVTAVINFAKSLPGKVKDGIVALGGIIRGLAVSAWNGFRSAVVSGINSTVSFVKGLPGRIRSAITSLGGLIRNVATSAWNSFRSAVVSGVNNTISFVRGLPGKIRGALGNLGGILLNSGKAIIDGLRNGINNGIQSVLNTLRDLGHKAKEAFNNALNIFSPSRDFFDSGEFIVQGAINGIKSKLTDMARMAQTLAKTIIAPTLQLPTAATMAINGIPTLPAVKSQIAASSDGGNDFGPYELKVDQGTLAAFTIDAVTGNPKPVAKAAEEGKRQNQFAGSGRKAS